MALLLSLPPAAVAQPAPEELVRETAEEVVSLLESHREQLETEPQTVYALVQEEVLPHFDFEMMSRLVLGRYWRRASEDQQAAFQEEFRQLLVRTYARSLESYDGQEIAFLPSRGSVERGDVTVRTEIRDDRGMAIPIDYRLHRTDAGDWQVYDVTVEGVSLVTNYRASFAQQIRMSGIDGVIEQMRSRNREQAG